MFGWPEPIGPPSSRLLDLGPYSGRRCVGIAVANSGMACSRGYAAFASSLANACGSSCFPLVVPNTPPKDIGRLAARGLTWDPQGLPYLRPACNQLVDRSAGYLRFSRPQIICRRRSWPTRLRASSSTASTCRLKRAREIGSYELMERIGEGGMGEVWRAKHRLLARPAAIKLIRSDVLGAGQRTREAIVRRFEREAQDTATLGSPHTIDVYDFGITEEGDFYYVMELLRRASASTARARLRTDGAGARGLSAAAGLSLARRGARARPRPPRHQAGQHLHVPARARRRFRQGARLRPGQATRLRWGHDAR